jgi:hypothetical protein
VENVFGRVTKLIVLFFFSPFFFSPMSSFFYCGSPPHVQDLPGKTVFTRNLTSMGS